MPCAAAGGCAVEPGMAPPDRSVRLLSDATPKAQTVGYTAVERKVIEVTTSTITRLTTAPAYAVLPAEDLERARAFYEDTLGLRVTDLTGEQFLLHAGSGTQVLVYQRERTAAKHTVMSFVVDDVRATVSELKSRGVTFEDYDLPGIVTHDGIAEMEDGTTAAWFTDPEGNIVNISATR